jgi:hypothetical protein
LSRRLTGVAPHPTTLGQLLTGINKQIYSTGIHIVILASALVAGLLVVLLLGRDSFLDPFHLVLYSPTERM